MMSMSRAFQKMNASLENNLKSVNNHIKMVQNGNLNAQAPELESLGKILSQIHKKIGSSILNSILHHTIP